jgi:hypothetical protein
MPVLGSLVSVWLRFHTLLDVILGVNDGSRYSCWEYSECIRWFFDWLALIVGPAWTPVFLIFWVISNVITGFFPNEILSNFYKWGTSSEVSYLTSRSCVADVSYCQRFEYSYIWDKKLAKTEFWCVISLGNLKLRFTSYYIVVRNTSNEREFRKESSGG